MDVTTGDYGRIDARGNLQLLQAADQVSDGGRRITSGPPCSNEAACAAELLIEGVPYRQSCGLIDPQFVTGEVYAAGEGVTAHVLDGVDPRVMAAWETTCEPPLEGRWHVMFSAEEFGTDEHNAAWCRVSLNGPDPTEGYAC